MTEPSSLGCQETALPDGRILLEYESVTSTQDIALTAVWAGRRDVAAVRSDHQTAGRGRSGGSWTAEAGTCLLASYILHAGALQPTDAPQLAFVAAVAAANAILTVTGLEVGFKWPNDLLIDGRKLGGILVETARLPDGSWAAIAGIGVNVNCIPPELASSAISIRQKLGRTVTISDLEGAVRLELASVFDTYGKHGFAPIRERWLLSDRTPGMRFQATVNGTLVPGTAVGIEETGALRIQCDSGELIEVYSASSLSDL